MARTHYTATFPAAPAGARVSWPDDLLVYLDASGTRTVAEAYLDEDSSVSLYSDVTSLPLTVGTETLTLTTGAPTATGAAAPTGGSVPVASVETAGFVVQANTAGDGLELAPVSTAVVPGTDLRSIDIGAFSLSGTINIGGERLPANLAVTAIHQYTHATLPSDVGGGFGVSFPSTMDLSAALLQAVSITVYKVAGADGVPLASPYPSYVREYYDEFDNPFSAQAFITADFLAGSGDAGFSDDPGVITTDALGVYLVIAHARWAA